MALWMLVGLGLGLLALTPRVAARGKMPDRLPLPEESKAARKAEQRPGKPVVSVYVPKVESSKPDVKPAGQAKSEAEGAQKAAVEAARREAGQPARKPVVVTVDAPRVTKRSAQQASQDLYDYVVPLVKAGKGAKLGTKAAPNEMVAKAQHDMGRLPVDGIYGPATRERASKLLGKRFPARA